MADDYQMPTGTLMKGKRGVITGVANHQSIAWGIASQLAAQGAEMAFLHLPGMERRVEPLAESIGVKVLSPVDVTDDASMDAGFATVKDAFGTIDFFVHAIAFANKDELKGSFVENTTVRPSAESTRSSTFHGIARESGRHSLAALARSTS